MESQNLIENGFIIDLSNAKDTLAIINELSNILDMSESKEKNIYLKLRDVELSQSQLLSIKALISATGANLAFLDANTERTIASARELGINVSTITNELALEEVSEPQNSETENVVQDENGEHENQPAETEVQEPQAPGIDLPEFVVEESIKVQNSSDGQVSDVPSARELFPEQDVVVHSEVPYEIFKTEEIQEEKNKELPTLYLRQTLRSGQTLCYDGNILVIGDTHPGSELIAKGDITVWGVLGGIAHAGTSGDKNARIRALKLNGIQLRIAGIYAARANTENIPFIQRSNEYTPQEARIENDVLVVRSINNEL